MLSPEEENVTVIKTDQRDENVGKALANRHK